MLRDIRRYEYKKYVADLRRKGMSRESALEACIHTMQSIAVGSRGISELKEVGNG